MTTVANVTAPTIRPAQSQGLGSAIPQAMGVDPVKLLLRSKWLMAGSLVAGTLVGVLGHYVWMYTYPIYKPQALFECFPPEVSPWVLPGAGVAVSNEEITTFMQTQARLMKSEDMLQSIVESQKLRDVAPKWCDRFRSSSGEYNFTKMYRQLDDDLNARVLTLTRLVQMTVTWKKPQEAADILKLVKDEYMDRVRRRNDDSFKERTNALNKNIEDAKRELTLLQSQQATIIRNSNVDSADQRLTEANIRVQLLNQRMSEMSGELTDIATRIKIREGQKNDPGGVPVIPEEIKSRVSRDPFIVSLLQDITTIETLLDGYRRDGMRPEHKQYKALEAQLQSKKAELEVKQKELWAQEFDAELSMMQSQESSLKQQMEEAVREAGELKIRQTELTQVLTQLQDIKNKIEIQQSSVQSATDKLRDLNVTMAQPTAARIVEATKNIRVPREPEMPKLLFMIPAGAVLGLGLASGLVVLREIVDQRLKGPGDVGLIPRTPLVGWVADASEDPAGPGVVETAFRDRPRGLLAENYRQIRSTVIKKMEPSGHKTVLVAGCMPSSGATSVAANLALACAAAGKKVLLIDANFRRPAVHRIFGAAEGPGLADVLNGETTLSVAAQSVKDIASLKVLTAGPVEKRYHEALATPAFAAVLEAAKGEYDCVFVDVPPVVVSGDAAAVANKVDASILVARTFSEKRGMIARIKNEIAETRSEFFGVVVNGVKSSAGGYLKGNIKATHEYRHDAEVKA
jgi:capsular exopolysaccharide synthesis family protein